MRKQKNRILVAQGADDKEALQISQIRLGRLKDEYVRFSRAADLRTRNERAFVAGFGRGQAARATVGVRKLQQQADSIFSLGSADANLDMYMKEKSIIDTLSANGVKYRQRISDKEIIVDAGKPTIVGMRVHAQENLICKPDRADMTQERARSFVDHAKLTLYQQDRENLKFLAEDGYSIVNLQHELVTAVPQKWRKKYNQYIEEVVE
ncbi:MAG: hypothetical protein RSF82_02365 [Angelakisella sp.]